MWPRRGDAYRRRLATYASGNQRIVGELAAKETTSPTIALLNAREILAGDEPVGWFKR